MPTVRAMAVAPLGMPYSTMVEVRVSFKKKRGCKRVVSPQ
jgi:hypothetical protein